MATAFLLIALVGSGIMAQRVFPDSTGFVLLANAIATGGGLVALILAFGPQSGAHMNPVVTLAAAATGGLRWHNVPRYIGAQVAGGILGVRLAHIMFDLPVLQLSQHVRTGLPQWVAEVVATFGLLTVDLGWPSASRAGHGIRGRCLHHRSLLVHGVDLVRQSGGDDCARSQRHLRGYPANRRAGLYPRAARRCRSGASLAAAFYRATRLTPRAAKIDDAAEIASIYNEGIADRVATFETQPRSAEQVARWFDGRHPIVVVEDSNGAVLAFAASSNYRERECYAGIAEFSVYVARQHRGKGAGRLAMAALIDAATAAGFWKLVSRIFPENTASLALMARVGFRRVGVYCRHGMLDGEWRDCVIVERLLGDAG